MLNRDTSHLLLFAHRNDNDSTVNHYDFPSDVMQKILALKSETKFEELPALHYAAYGELDALQAMLEKDPFLVVLRGDVVTPGGVLVKNTTLLECALLSGDTELAEMILPYFDQFEGGAKERERQLEHCRPVIAALSEQQPEDLTELIQMIIDSPLNDVEKELETGDQYDRNYQSPLRQALNKFREGKLDHQHRIITEPRMHCNYQNLIHAHEIINTKWNDLRMGNNYSKCFLAFQQIIGLIQLLELPAYERYVFARGQMKKAKAGKNIKRETKYKYGYGTGSFPVYCQQLLSSYSGLGFDNSISIHGMGTGRFWWALTSELQTYVEQKLQTCKNLCSNPLRISKPRM